MEIQVRYLNLKGLQVKQSLFDRSQVRTNKVHVVEGVFVIYCASTSWLLGGCILFAQIWGICRVAVARKIRHASQYPNHESNRQGVVSLPNFYGVVSWKKESR